MVATIAAVAALASAGAGAYGAIQSGKSQKAANENARWAQDENFKINRQNADLDLINSLINQRQRQLDNTRYDESVAREEKQRDFTNRLSTVGMSDGQGGNVQYDPTTNTWRQSATGMALDNQRRGQQARAAGYDQAVVGNTRDAMVDASRRSQAGGLQAQQRALAQELLARYAGNQGRTPQQMEAAAIEKNVAGVTDPLQTGGNMAMLAGYRQGNSGNDALMGALARQSQGGTRAAIANARYGAPSDSAGEREAMSKSLLGPATTLAERGSSAPGDRAPVFQGDPAGGMLSGINRNNPAGVGSQLNPRGGSMIPTAQRGGTNSAFQPLNAEGNQWAKVAESFNSLGENKNINGLLSKWLGGSAKTDPNAPDLYGPPVPKDLW